MAYFDSIKIGGTIKQVQVVQELNALPSPVLETSPQLVKIGSDLYMRESKMGGFYGTYRFMLVPTNNQVHSIEFVSNGETFDEITTTTSGEMIYGNTLVYSNGNWVNDNYKTISIFDGYFTNNLDEFLRNNAEKIIDGYYKYIKVSSEGGSVVLEKDASTTGGSLTFADDITLEEFDTLWNNEFIMLNILTGSTEMTAQVLLKKVRQGTAGATPVMSMVFTQVQPTNETTINYTELTISKDTSDDYISSEFNIYDITSGSPKIVNLNEFVPSTATQGTLTVGALNVLQQSNENYIVFNNEIFRLADKQHNAGFLVYSHNGHDTTGCFFQKCITITLSTRAWVLKTQENQAKLTAGSNITIENNVISAENAITVVDALPAANEENFEKGKIYTQGELLQYIAKVALTEPNLSQVASLITAEFEIAAAAVGTNIYLFGGKYGTNYNNLSNAIYKFSTTSNTITTLSATLPQSSSAIAAAAVGNDIYLFGGQDINSSVGKVKTIYKFSTTSNTITTLSATLPVGLKNIAAAAVGTNIYLFGGLDVNTSVRTIYKFSTTTQQITTLSTTLPTAADYISAVSIGNDIYLFGGFTSNGAQNKIQKFSTSNNALTTLSITLPQASYGMASAAVGTDIYLFGGFESSKLNTITKFSTTTQQITTLSTTLPTAAGYVSASAVGDNVYLFGGYTGAGGSILNTINKAEFGFTYQYKTITAE